MWSLLLAYWLTWDWSKIALIDTENWSGDLYSHLWEYNVFQLNAPYTAERYTAAIHECEEAWMEVIIVDSLTHVWRWKWWLLEYQEKLWGTFKDWAKVTPIYQDFIDVILNSPAHIITTIRKKTKYEMTNENGKSKVTKLWLDDEIRDGYEYEMTVAFSLNENLYAYPSKDRTSLFKLKQEEILSEETGKKLKEWSESWIDPVQFEKELKERKENEEKEKLAKEQREKDDLYSSFSDEMENIKFIDDLADLWNNRILPQKDFLGKIYLADLAERKDAIKTQLSQPPKKQEDKEETKPAPKKASPKKEIIPETPEESQEEVEEKEEVSQEESVSSEDDDPLIPEEIVTPVEKDPKALKFEAFITQIKATTNIEELNAAWKDVEAALWNKEIELFQHWILASHKWIMLKKFPTQ